MSTTFFATEFEAKEQLFGGSNPFVSEIAVPGDVGERKYWHILGLEFFWESRSIGAGISLFLLGELDKTKGRK